MDGLERNFTTTRDFMKIYHRADKINKNGAVSALCFLKPKRINLSKELWTLRDEAVTCEKCLAIIKLRSNAKLRGAPQERKL